MQRQAHANLEDISIEDILEVQERVMDSLTSSSLAPLAEQFRPYLADGKMLRARLLLRVSAVTSVSREDRLCAAAAVELIHAASLLHDDVIDEGRTRRGVPAFWVKEGVKGAVLLGDLMVCKAFSLVQQRRNGSLVRLLTDVAHEMCDAEAQQELLLRDEVSDWDTCVSLARRKTGSLFAFAACAGAGPTEPLATTLREAGYTIGTAYQLADDVFDANGDPFLSDKSLGRDAANLRPTAVSTSEINGIDPGLYIRELCESAQSSLSKWPEVKCAWDAYMAADMGPALATFLEPAQVEALS